MRQAAAVLLLLAAGCASAPRAVVLTPADDLRARVESSGGPARFVLAPGRYVLQPRPFRDPTCANCQDPATSVEATVGLRLSGERIEIIGPATGEAIIETNAGYGLLVEDCRNCLLERITVTGGRRDRDGNASDGAVVVRRSRLTVRAATIRDNIGDPVVVHKTVVGIIGIVGREGAEMLIENNRILRNSWDGIALYRGAQATIRENVIDGVDKARGVEVGGGRGVGIGLTWDARANVERNLVTRYWKGIGVFVAAVATVRHNVVEDVVTWGLTLWDADQGDAAGTFEGNAIYRVGACGAAVTRRAPCHEDLCSMRGNAFVLTGLNPKYDSPDHYCRQEALALESPPAGMVIGGNLFLANREANGRPGKNDMTRADFLRRVGPLVEALRRTPILATSRFVRDVAEVSDGWANATPP